MHFWSSRILFIAATFLNVLIGLHCGFIGQALADDPNLQFDANRLYGSERVTKIEITMEPPLWDKLRLQKRDFVEAMIDPKTSSFDYFQGNIKIDGFEIPNVAFRKKGFFGSIDDDFPSLRVKLDEYVDQAPLGAIKRLTLNNNKQDLSLLSQFMAYRYFNEVGISAPRVGFATLFVNGTHLGVYSVVEAVDKPFLATNFGDNSGDLLEGTLSDFSKKSIKRLEFKSGANKSSDKWRVNELAELLESDELDLKKLEQVIDMDSFYRFWATESLLACWDGYNSNQNNYFVYDNPKTGRLHFMPWGADALWSTMAGPFGAFSKPNESVYTNSVLSHALFKSEAGQEAYLRTLRELLENHWNEAALSEKIDELSNLLEPHLHNRQKGAEQNQKSMKRFIESRRQKINRELDKWPVTIPEKARRPSYTNEVGLVSGEFETFWQRVPKDKESNTKLSLKLDGKTIEFEETKVIAKRFSMGWMSFAAPADSLPPIVEVKGKTTDGESYTLTVSFDNADFDNSADNEKKSVRIRGSINKVQPGGSSWPMGGANMRFLQGTCELSQASMTSGAPVVGKFEAKVIRLVGGLFGG